MAEFLRKCADKYPSEVQLLDNPDITRRLTKIMGSDYAFLKETWKIETPSYIADNAFVASGCKQHDCGGVNFIIVVDLAANTMYAGVRRDNSVISYSENGGTHPYIELWERRAEE